MDSIEHIWRDRVAFLFEFSPKSPESLLCSFIGFKISSGFEGFLNAVFIGNGYGDDGGGIFLPANVLDESLDEGIIERGFWVEVVLFSHADDVPNDVARLPVSAFVFYVSLAIMLYVRHVDSELDPYDAIERITRGCSPETQFALVPIEQRERAGLQWHHWQPSREEQ